MKKYRTITFLVIFTVVFGCSSIKVSQDYDLSTSFTGLKTYDWQSETQKKTNDALLDNPLLDARIRSAVDRVLKEMGYQKVSHDTPDFFVAYQHTVQRRIGTDNVRTGVGFGFGSSGRYGGIGVGTGAEITEYDEGILVIDVIHADNNDLMWRGIGTRRVSQHSDPEKRTKHINETVAKILTQFPPQAKK
jgi:hypothetical protein